MARVTQIAGSVTITHSDGSTTIAVIGSPVLMGDAIETSKTSAVNLQFTDNTTLALTDNGRLTIDKFIYNPEDHSGSASFSILHAIFVYTAGLMDKTNQDNVRIETEVGCICIRGTEFILSVDPERDFAEIDLIRGEVAFAPRLPGVTTIVDAPETADFSSSGVTGTAPLNQAQYDQLKSQVLAPFQTDLTASDTTSTSTKGQLLARTGADFGGQAAVGLIALLAGLLLVVFARRLVVREN